jgi:ligand-binding SRPBCC domain-containing protein
MATLKHQVVIDLPVEQVFTFVTSAANNLQWQPSLQATWAMTRAPVGVGSRYGERRTFMGIPVASEYLIEEFDPPRGCAVRAVGGPISFRVTYRLRPSGRSTVMEVEGAVIGHALPRLAVGAAVRSANRELAANLRALKVLLERRTDSAGDTAPVTMP